MKVIVILTFLVSVTFARDPLSSNIDFEKLDINILIDNDRLLGNYIRCLLKGISCTHEGRELKKIIPNALQSGCVGCSPKTVENIDRVVQVLKTKRPKDWADLSAKYDPEGKYEKLLKARKAMRKS